MYDTNVLFWLFLPVYHLNDMSHIICEQNSAVLFIDLENIISGNMDKEVNFSFGYRTDVDGSCGVTFKNEHFIFGGFSEQRQVYKR